MDGSQMTWLSEEDFVFHRLESYHRERVEALLGGSSPLYKPENGVILLHLIPEKSVVGRNRFSGSDLKEHGGQMPAFGEQIGSPRFNVDGLIERNRTKDVRAYSQLFRDGRLESVMSDLTWPQDRESLIRFNVCEQGLFRVSDAYTKFCQGIGIQTPIWVFTSLLNCKGARPPSNHHWIDNSEHYIDRSPAHLPELKITSFPITPHLRPLCDSIWQAAGIERSPNFDEHGNWKMPSY